VENSEDYESEDSTSPTVISSSSTASTSTTGITTKRPTIPPEYIINQVNKIVGNVQTGNLLGIIDESLGIRNHPVQNLVRGILRVVFCNPLDQFLNLCKQNVGTTPSKVSISPTPTKIKGSDENQFGSTPIGSLTIPIGSNQKLGSQLNSVLIHPAGSKRFVERKEED